MVIIEDSSSRLNPKIFSGNRMKPEVRERVLEIVEEFYRQFDENFSFNILDVVLVGSNAAYNYTENSDLDVHIVVDLYQICKEKPEIVQYLFNSEKSRFNLNYDISIKGIQVEIYVEDIRSSTMSNGIYSVKDNCWIKFPKEEDTYSSSVIRNTTRYSNVVNKVNSALLSGDSDEIKSVISDLYLMRKQGLETLGELSDGNLIFKEIRNQGLLDRLKDSYYEVRSDELSLESIKRRKLGYDEF